MLIFYDILEMKNATNVHPTSGFINTNHLGAFELKSREVHFYNKEKDEENKEEYLSFVANIFGKEKEIAIFKKEDRLIAGSILIGLYKTIALDKEKQIVLPELIEDCKKELDKLMEERE